jgi:hypothetical protein
MHEGFLTIQVLLMSISGASCFINITPLAAFGQFDPYNGVPLAQSFISSKIA